ncbi:branched-chain amino acid ABC transporter permease [Phytohabitans sp. ZYX-F-186]|uniref:Branched-chain amino acid ABC transporter permease n=1 Tax=Phytohabitans maris TaxID=3071409 RepID=A0ABU0ZKA8_9ACTN|nr:branched-chain amino acid ABC transporter permease [Phytohabitans sp. ZYX-F-186]MDQ7907485.1 branched-chain amino acid ABC transporter permease [Phytohabitans sp. ZYX-F-186]
MISLAITALSTTAVLVPLVISVSLLFRVSGVVNFGTGGFCVFAGAACATWSASNAFTGVVLTLLAGAVLGGLCYLVAIYPAQRQGVPAIGLTLATLGVGLLLTFLTRTWFGGEPSIVQPWLSGSVTIGDYQTARQRLLVIVLAALLVGLLYLLFDRTLIGRALTAVAHDPELASMYGIRARRFEILAWVVSGVCVIIGGMFQATLASVSVDVAPTLLVYALVGAVIGGLGSLFGAVGGALIAGIGMTLTDEYIQTGYHLTALFVILSLVLVVRPQGLFTFRGTAERV